VTPFSTCALGFPSPTLGRTGRALQRSVFVLLTLALTACFEERHRVTEREVVGTYLNGSGYKMHLAANYQLVVSGDSGKPVASGTWELQENGERIVFEYCSKPSAVKCRNPTNGISNQPIGKNDKKIVIGNGELINEDYTKLWVADAR